MPFFFDAFTGTDATTLQAHAPNTGTSWTRLWGTNVLRNLEINGNACRVSANAGDEGLIYTADATYPSANYDITWTQITIATVANPYYAFVRIQDQENMYGVYIKFGTTLCQLYKKVAGTWSALGSAFDEPADGSVCKLEINGTALKFYDDGIEVASATDSDISAAGKAGIGAGGGAELVTSTDDLRIQKIDTLSVNDLGGGASTYNDSVSVSRRETFSDGMTNNISPLILISQRDGVSDGMNNSIPKNSSLNKVLTLSDFAVVGIYPSLTLNRDLAFVPANIALVGGSVSIGQALGLIDVPRLDARSSLSFLQSLGINLSSALSANQVQAILTLAEKLGLGTSSQLNSFPLVGVNQRVFLVDANNANMLGSNVLSEIRTFNVAGGIAVQDNVSIPIDLNILTNKLVAIYGNVTVQERLGISDSVFANMQAIVALGEKAGMGNTVNQLLNAGLTINVVGSVLTISGLTVIIVKGFVFTSDSARNSLSTSDYSSTSLGSDSANSVETGDS